MFNKIFALLLILAFANAIQIESDLTKVGKDYKRDCPLCAYVGASIIFSFLSFVRSVNMFRAFLTSL